MAFLNVPHHLEIFGFDLCSYNFSSADEPAFGIMGFTTIVLRTKDITLLKQGL
jgi:hypothetical protein